MTTVLNAIARVWRHLHQHCAVGCVGRCEFPRAFFQTVPFLAAFESKEAQRHWHAFRLRAPLKNFGAGGAWGAQKHAGDGTLGQGRGGRGLHGRHQCAHDLQLQIAAAQKGGAA